MAKRERHTRISVCLDWKLDIEIDGKNHFTEAGRQHDENRDAYVREQGFDVLRLNGFRVTQDRDGVRKEMEQAIRNRREQLG